MSFRNLALFGFIFGFYSRFHLNIGPLYIPYIISFLSGVSLLVINKGVINKKSFNFFITLGLVTSLVFLLTVLTKNVKVKPILESLIFFEYSIFLGLIFLDELCRFDNDRLSKVLYKIVLVVLGFCLLDIFTPFHEINLFVIDLFGGHNQGDFAANREQAYFFGIRRPFPFTLEPSHVSKFLLIILSGWLVLSRDKQYLKFYLLCFISLIIIRSPIVIGAVSTGVLYQITNSSSRQNIRKYSSTLFIVGVLLLISSVIVYLVLEVRIRSILNGGDPSTYFRLVRPFFILKESVLYSPFFGVGVGNTEKLAELYISNYTSWVNNELGIGYTISNFVAPIAFWGIAGTLIHFVIIRKFVSERLALDNYSSLFLLYFLISISMGGFNNVDYWAYLVLIVRFFHNPTKQ